MSKYVDLFTTGLETLERAGITEARLDSRLLLEYVCGTDHSTLLAHPDMEVSDENKEKYLVQFHLLISFKPHAKNFTPRTKLTFFFVSYF